MIDIVEAGKFYLECLKKVHESILKQDVLPQNTVLNAKADLVQRGGHLDKRLIGVFKLNNINHTFEIGISPTDSVRDIVYNATLRIANVIADAVIQSIDWDTLDGKKAN